jgi:uncharacterized OsmC-like protein
MRIHVAKRWSVNALSEGQAPLQYFCDGRPLTQAAPATIDNVSPVEFLLIAVAGCFALSCRAVLAKRKLPRISFEVVATGEKLTASPNRLDRIAVVAIFGNGISESEAAAISEEAKPMCTVANTISASQHVLYSARVLKEHAAVLQPRSQHIHH